MRRFMIIMTAMAALSATAQTENAARQADDAGAPAAISVHGNSAVAAPLERQQAVQTLNLRSGFGLLCL